MMRRVRAAAAVVVGSALVMACGSAEPVVEKVEATQEALERPGNAIGSAGGPAEVWFAVRATSCRDAAKALAAFANQPGAVAPETVRATESAPWCSLAVDERQGARADSMAQNVAAHMGTTSIAFYVADGAWSYAIFDRGEPVCAMESHYGEPVLVGSADRGASALGLPNGTALKQLVANARDPGAHRRLAARIGVAYPAPEAPRLLLASLGREAAAAQPDPVKAVEGLGLEFHADQWVVMAPLGVMLIKEIDNADPAKPVYVAIAGSQTLRVPASSAVRMGMRPIATAAEADSVLALLDEEIEVPDAQEYLEPRARGWLTALKGGDLRDIAEAYRAVCTIRAERNLFAIEAGLLDSARAWLLDELTTAKKVMREEIDAALGEACD